MTTVYSRYLPANIFHANRQTVCVTVLCLHQFLYWSIAAISFRDFCRSLLMLPITVAIVVWHCVIVDCVYIFSSSKEEKSVSVDWVLMSDEQWGNALRLTRSFLLFTVTCALSEWSSFQLCGGSVSNVDMSLLLAVVLDSNGKSRGYGFVRFATETDQQSALIEMQGYTRVNRKPLRISLATPKRLVSSIALSSMKHLPPWSLMNSV